MTSPYHLDRASGADTPSIRIIPDYLVPERNGATVWWTEVKRVGDWIVPRSFRNFTFMGNTELDLTSAQIGAGTSEIEVKCILGNVEIRVPMEIRVLCEGDGVAGTFEVERVGEVDPPPIDAPTVLITGSAYLGSVTVKIMGRRAPGWKERLKSARDFFYG